MTFKPKHLLVPVDVDPVADRSLADRLVEDACAFAHLVGAKVTLLHIAVPTVTPAFTLPDGQAYQAMQDVLEARRAASARTLKELERRVDVPVTSRMIIGTGSVPEMIIDAAREMGADMIVLTTHARRGLARFFLGSVAERTSHLSTFPVLLLPPR